MNQSLLLDDNKKEINNIIRKTTVFGKQGGDQILTIPNKKPQEELDDNFKRRASVGSLMINLKR